MIESLVKHGSLNQPSNSTSLKAGKLSMLYEDGFIRLIKVGNVEILRMINHAVRNNQWGTIDFKISNESILHQPDSFTIQYKARCQENDIDFHWDVSIVGHSDSTLTFQVEGIAKSSFQSNRIGLTVLHPLIECLANPCTITHTDNRKEVLKFPDAISPHQPFLDIAEMEWSPTSNIIAKLKFEGEVFETEDQRNWADASFKTYGTPLSKPFPVSAQTGEKVNQLMKLSIHTSENFVEAVEPELTFNIDVNQKISFPCVGIPIAQLPHNEREINLLTELRPDFLSVTLFNIINFDTIKWHETLWICHKAKTNLQIKLWLNSSFDFLWLEQWSNGASVCTSVIILQHNRACPDAKLLNEVTPILKRIFPKAKIGSGTDSFFAELNRSFTPVHQLDFVSFPVTPQVHSFDQRSITENLEALPHLVQDAKKISANNNIHIGPITLKMRSSNNNPEGLYGLPEHTDPRQLSVYAASWSIACFKKLAQSGVAAISFFETCGRDGLFNHSDESWPKQFNVPEDYIYPIYHALKELLKFKHNPLLNVTSTHPTIFELVAFRNENQDVSLLITNLTQNKIEIKLPATLKMGNEDYIQLNSFEWKVFDFKT